MSAKNTAVFLRLTIQKNYHNKIIIECKKKNLKQFNNSNNNKFTLKIFQNVT